MIVIVIDFCVLIEREVQLAVHKKRKTHNRKLSKLVENSRCEFAMTQIADNFVYNESSEQFDVDELNLLNMGLKFTPKPTKISLLDTIVDIE